MGVGRARLRHVRAPQDEETRIVPVSRFRHVGLLAPGLRRSRRQIAIPVVKRHAGAADQAQIPRSCSVGHHRHGRDRREAEDPVRAIFLGGIGIGRSGDFRRLVPGSADEAALAALGDIVGAHGRIRLDRRPGLDCRLGLAQLAPHLHQPCTHQRRFHPVGRVQIPAVTGAAGTAARLVIGQVRPGARIICLLGLPGDDTRFDVDLPGAGSGAVDPMRGTDDFVVLPALAVDFFPIAAFHSGFTMTVRECIDALAGEEVQSVEQMAHLVFSFQVRLSREWWQRCAQLRTEVLRALCNRPRSAPHRSRRRRGNPTMRQPVRRSWKSRFHRPWE